MRVLVVVAVLAVAMCGGVLAADLAAPVVLAVQQGPTQANMVNPYELLHVTRAELVQRFPNMPAAELDKLVFKIADINSMRSLPR